MFCGRCLQACTTCAPNTFSQEGSFECLPCVPGEYESESECKKCEAGKFDHDSVPATQCKDCPAGTSSAKVGQTTNNTCVQCTIGHTSLAGAKDCTRCPTGKVDHDQNAATPCDKCPAGSVAMPCVDDWSGLLASKDDKCGTGGIGSTRNNWPCTDTLVMHEELLVEPGGPFPGLAQLTFKELCL